MEDQDDILRPLRKDTNNVLIETLFSAYLEEDKPSDDELELDGAEELDRGEGRTVMAPPRYSELLSRCEQLEECAALHDRGSALRSQGTKKMKNTVPRNARRLYQRPKADIR